MNKQTIRNEMRAARAALSSGRQQEAASAVARQVLALEQYRKAETIMAYIAARGELDLAPVIREILSSGKRLVLPRCEAAGVMTARAVSQLDELVSGMYGLLEPAPRSRIVAADQIDLILVPGTAFGRDGSRIGQGGGYYDRFLPETGALRVGICHDFALFDALPMQEFDAKMNVVCTPGGVHWPQEMDYGGHEMKPLE